MTHLMDGENVVYYIGTYIWSIYMCVVVVVVGRTLSSSPGLTNLSVSSSLVSSWILF